MDTSGNCVVRTDTMNFALGVFNLEVTASRDDEAPIDEVDVDHVMAALLKSVDTEIASLNEMPVLMRSKDGSAMHASARSMELGGTTLQVKVTMVVDRDIANLWLLMVVDRILDQVKGCMLHVLDSDVTYYKLTVTSIGGFLNQMFLDALSAESDDLLYPWSAWMSM